ncbi:MAG: sugar ABC transporter substrate-binding protein [Clostridia bacterium]|nr:sugar ABC transporter substrate-binding protein [Clostridia bacterium]
MKKKILSVILAMLMLTALLAGCGGNTDEGSAEPQEETQKYALLMSHMTNAFTMELSGAVKDKADELGVSLTVFDGENDAAKQISQAESAISQGYDAIIIEAISVDGIKPAVQAAKDAGIPIVTINQKITQQELANCFVGVSHVEGGSIEMEKVVEDLDGKGNIAILLGPMGSDGQIGRREGYSNVLESYPDIEIVFEQSANWKTDEALKLVENWLQTGKEINAIVAQNDGMALGALKAVEDAKLLENIKVYGVDAVPDALAAVQEGRLSATVSQSTTNQGLQAMEACYKIVNGETVPEEIIVGHTLITQDNVADFIK